MLYSLALDKSTDQIDTAQLAIFVRGVDSNFNVFEELLSIASLKNRTTGEYMFKAFKNVMEFYDLRFKNLAGVATDGAPSMIGKHSGLAAFLKKQEGIDKNTFIDYHCIIHQENLCAKTLQFDAVMKMGNTVVKFIWAKTLNHRQFQNFLTSEWEADHGDVIYYCDIRWLSRANVLKRIAELKDPIQEFMTLKNKPILEFGDPQFMSDFAFLTDISSHLATLNLKLQQRGQLVNALFSHVRALQAKLKLFEQQLGKKDLSHFPIIAHMNCKEYAPNFVKCISELQNTFSEPFFDFRLQERNINFVTQPFFVEAEDAPTEFQLELIDLQCDEFIKKKFGEISVDEFYRKYSYVHSEKFPKLKKNAARIIFLFGSTYVCEQMFSRMKHVKNRIRSSITDSHLEQCMCLATTSLDPEIDFLVREKQSQVAH